MMELDKRLEDQEFTDEEKRWVDDWLSRIADGRIIVNFYRGSDRPKAFGVDISATCDKEQVRQLCEKVRMKDVKLVIIHEGDGRIERVEGIVIP